MNQKIQISFLEKVKSGFTLVEMVIVIGILGIFLISASLLNNNTQSDREKFDRLNSLIADTIRMEHQNMFLGKNPMRNGVAATSVTLELRKTSALRKVYRNISGGVISTESLPYPYFGDARARITTLIWTGSSTPANNSSGAAVDIIITSAGITLSGGVTATTLSAPLLQIQTNYTTATGIVQIDKRVGRIDIIRQ